MNHILPSILTAAALFAMPVSAQALIFQFNAGLSGANEVPPVTTSATGVATLFYNDNNSVITSDDTYNFSLSAFGLSGVATGMHIHAPAPAGSNAGIVVNLGISPFVVFNPDGTLLIGGASVVPPSSLLGHLQGGLAYVNIHTALNPTGEIRGQLLPVAVVPEPSTYGMMLAGLGLLGFVARRKRQMLNSATTA